MNSKCGVQSKRKCGSGAVLLLAKEGAVFVAATKHLQLQTELRGKLLVSSLEFLS